MGKRIGYSTDDDAKLEAIYRDVTLQYGGLIQALREAFPDRTETAIQQRAFYLGLTKIRRELLGTAGVQRSDYSADELARLEALYLDPTIGRGKMSAAIEAAFPERSLKGVMAKAESLGLPDMRRQMTLEPQPAAPRVKSAPKHKAAAPIAAVSVLRAKPGACDAGDREYIRRRLIHAIDQLATELNRTRTSIADAVCKVAEQKFAAEVFGGYAMADLEPQRGRAFKRDNSVEVA
jgi:hypothetical protein